MLLKENRRYPFDRENLKVRTEVALSATLNSITAAANGGGGEVDLTSANHGLAPGDLIDITGTTSYNGTDLIVAGIIDANTFSVTDTFVADETGNWAYASNWNNKEIFKGHALPGKADDTAGWQIYKNQFDIAGNATNRNFAQHNGVEVHDFVFIWDNRKTLLYGV